jgi:hypothetical protein
MSFVITTPTHPFANQPFVLNDANNNLFPQSNQSYVLQNIHGTTVSNVFTSPTNNTTTFTNIVNTSSEAGLAVDNNNNFYLCNLINNTIIKITPEGEQSLFATISEPLCVVYNPLDNNLYVSSGTSGPNYFIYKISLNGVITLYYVLSAIAITVAIDPTGILYFTQGVEVHKLVSGVESVFFVLPSTVIGIAFDTSNYLYASYQNNIQKISPFGSDLGIYSSFATNTDTILTLKFDKFNQLYFTAFATSYDSSRLGAYYYLVATDGITNTILTYSVKIYFSFVFNSINNLYFNEFITATTTNLINLYYLTFTFTGVILPAGYNLLSILDLTTNTVVKNNIIVIIGSICFKEDTNILCFDTLLGCDVQIPIQNIVQGTPVKIYSNLGNEYKQVKYNIKDQLQNTRKKTIHKLYRFNQKMHKGPSLTVTGSHSLLYNKLSPQELSLMKQMRKNMKEQFDVDYPIKINDQYKLLAYFDSHFTEINDDNIYNIYHLVLDDGFNHGIYADEILTESTDLMSLTRFQGIKTINSVKNTTQRKPWGYGGHTKTEKKCK